MMNKDIIIGLETAFGEFKLTNPEQFLNCRRTAFSWTKLPTTLCLAANKKYFRQAVKNININAIAALPDAVQGDHAEKACLISDQAAEIFYYLHNLAIHADSALADPETGVISDSAVVADSAIIGPEVTIGAGSQVLDGCIISGPVSIGDNVIVAEGCRIGTQGFFSKRIQGQQVHIRHYGGVSIGDDCYIHAGANIARSANVQENTIVEDRVHIGISCLVGHDCIIQAESRIATGAMICGRAKIGRNVWVGASAVVSNALLVGESANIQIGSIVIDNVPDGANISGNFATAHGPRLRQHVMRSRQ